MIQLFLGFVLTAASSQRGAAAVFNLLAETCRLELPAPCPHAGRLWMLRVGLDALQSPKEQASDWVWIMDHTLQLGEWKCLVIVTVHTPQATIVLRSEDVGWVVASKGGQESALSQVSRKGANFSKNIQLCQLHF